MFRGIDYENLKEGDLITFYGVHVLRWEDDIRPYGIEPTIAFVQDDSLEKENRQLREALGNLSKETRKAHADRNNLTPGCAVCDAIKEAEQVLAATDPTE